jgi:hypothetical protein
MTDTSRKYELQGIRYVQGVVEDCGSAFQEFASKNDIGNDCHVEFRNGPLQCYGIYGQIKSGPSYKDSSGYKIPALQRHLMYWSDALYQIIGFVYDVDLKTAFWVDISQYLVEHPEVLKQSTHEIRIPPSNAFSNETFDEFKTYCFEFREKFRSVDKHLKSLELFASIDPDLCYEGFKALISNHSDNASTWMYIVTSFGRIEEEGIRRNILGVISNYASNADVLWHAGNKKYWPGAENDRIKKIISEILGKSIHSREIKLMLPYMRDGVTRGSFAYRIFLILDMIKNSHEVLKSICFEGDLNSDDRNFCFWLYMNIAKFHSTKETLLTADQYVQAFPDAREDEALIGTLESIKNGDLWPVG